MFSFEHSDIRLLYVFQRSVESWRGKIIAAILLGFAGKMGYRAFFVTTKNRWFSCPVGQDSHWDDRFCELRGWVEPKFDLKMGIGPPPPQALIISCPFRDAYFTTFGRQSHTFYVKTYRAFRGKKITIFWLYIFTHQRTYICRVHDV